MQRGAACRRQRANARELQHDHWHVDASAWFVCSALCVSCVTVCSGCCRVDCERSHSTACVHVDWSWTLARVAIVRATTMSSMVM